MREESPRMTLCLPQTKENLSLPNAACSENLPHFKSVENVTMNPATNLHDLRVGALLLSWANNNVHETAVV